MIPLSSTLDHSHPRTPGAHQGSKWQSVGPQRSCFTHSRLVFHCESDSAPSASISFHFNAPSYQWLSSVMFMLAVASPASLTEFSNWGKKKKSATRPMINWICFIVIAAILSDKVLNVHRCIMCGIDVSKSNLKFTFHEYIQSRQKPCDTNLQPILLIECMAAQFVCLFIYFLFIFIWSRS